MDELNLSLMTVSMRDAVVKSALCRLRRRVVLPARTLGISRSTSAPLGMLPAVGWFFWALAAWPPKAKELVSTDPWATAYIWLSPPLSGVMIRVPPAMLLASPRDD